MSSNLALLFDLMPPPTTIRSPDEGVLHRNQQILDIEFPSDFVDFSRAYGSGKISVHKYSWEVVDAFNEKLPMFVLKFISNRGHARNFMDGVQIPFGLFPEVRGMLPFGRRDRDYFGWITDGEPNSWKVVVNWGWDNNEYAIYDVGFVEFWINVVSLQLQIPGYSCDWDPKSDVSFEQVLHCI